MPLIGVEGPLGICSYIFLCVLDTLTYGDFPINLPLSRSEGYTLTGIFDPWMRGWRGIWDLQKFFRRRRPRRRRRRRPWGLLVCF